MEYAQNAEGKNNVNFHLFYIQVTSHIRMRVFSDTRKAERVYYLQTLIKRNTKGGLLVKKQIKVKQLYSNKDV